MRNLTTCTVLPASEYKNGGSYFTCRKNTMLLRKKMAELRELEDDVAFIEFKAECRTYAQNKG